MTISIGIQVGHQQMRTPTFPPSVLPQGWHSSCTSPPAAQKELEFLQQGSLGTALPRLHTCHFAGLPTP